MLTLPDLTKLVNDENRKIHDDVLKSRDVYYGMSLHIDGACPMWTSLRDNRLGWIQGNFIETRPILGWFGVEYHKIFDVVLFNRYPNEKEVTRQWRFSQYKPFQKAFFGKAISMVTGAIFQDSGYSVTVEDREDNEYIWGKNFRSGEYGKTNLINYFAGQFKAIASDPNGYFCIVPKEPAAQTTTQRIEPGVWFINSKDIIFRSEHEVVFKREEYIWAVNEFGYFRWVKNEASKKWELVEPEGYYPHMLGYIPAIIAGGVWSSQGFYDSWLNDGKAIADDYVIIKSDEAMCAKQASHPFIIEASEDCPECENGKIQWCNTCNHSGDSCNCSDSAELFLRSCDGCHGTGYISHNPGDRLIAPKEDMERALIQVVNVPVDANEMHAKRAERAELNLQKSLHLNYIDEAQSGTAKDKDMETRYQFILAISNDFFDRIIPTAIEIITSLRNITVSDGTIKPTPVNVQIVKPTQFQIKTSFDLLEELKAGKESGIPEYQKGALLEDYVDKQFGGNEALKRKTNLINQLDKLANKSVADISIMVLNNAATNRDWQYSVAIPIIIDAIIRDWGSERFLGAQFDLVKEEIQRIFDAEVPEVIAVQPDVTERINA